MSEFKSPRKRFGQNFLQDQNIIDKIIAAIAPRHDDSIIEIGPGRGALTLPLLEKLEQLHVIEIDRDLISWWHEKQIANLKLHELDALKADICSIYPGQPEHQCRIVGNLPYNISTPLLFHLFTYLPCIKDMHFMLQKEVVERITASPGSKIYGRLSLMTQFYCQTQNLFSVSRHAFSPAPKVESAIVQLIPHTEQANAPAETFAAIVKQAFSQRRKTIRNSLKDWFSTAQLETLQLDPSARPETLSLDTFKTLAKAADNTPAG